MCYVCVICMYYAVFNTVTVTVTVTVIYYIAGSVVTEFSSLLSSNEGRGDYGSLEGTGSSVTASANSSSSNTTSIVDFETKSKVAEIDLESRHPSSRDSTRVVHLPPGKYEFTSGPEGKKFGIYTDYVGE